MKKQAKLLVLLLSLLLIIASFTVVSFAAEESQVSNEVLFTVTKGDGTTTSYTTVAEFEAIMSATDGITNLGDGAVIKLYGDIEYNGMAYSSNSNFALSNGSATLDLNGHTLELKSGCLLVLYGNLGGQGSANYTNFTLKSSAEGGKLVSAGTSPVFYVARNHKVITVEGDNLTVEVSKLYYYVRYGSRTGEGNKLILNGGSYIQTGNTQWIDVRDAAGFWAEVKVQFNGASVVQSDSVTSAPIYYIRHESGTAEVDYSKSNKACLNFKDSYVYVNSSFVTLSAANGIVNLQNTDVEFSDSASLMKAGSGKIIVYGDSTVGKAPTYSTDEYDDSDLSGANSGIFFIPIEVLFSVDYFEGESVNYYEVSDFENLIINGLSNLPIDTTITLHKDITCAGIPYAWGGTSNYHKQGGNITLDVNGNTLTITSGCLVQSIGSVYAEAPQVFNITSSEEGGKLVSNSSYALIHITRNYKEFYINGENLTVECPSLMYYYQYGNNDGVGNKLECSGGTYVKTGSAASYWIRIKTDVYSGVYNQARVSVAFTNATLKAENNEGHMLWGNAAAALSNYTFNQTSLFSLLNCTVECSGSFATLDTPNTVLVLRNCDLTKVTKTLSAGQGKIILSRDTKLNSLPNLVAYEYDGTVLNGDNKGIFIESDCKLVNVMGGGYLIAYKSDAKEFRWVIDGEAVLAGWYHKNTENPELGEAPVLESMTATMVWEESIDGSVTVRTAVAKTALKAPQFFVSTNLETELKVNLYIPKAFYDSYVVAGVSVDTSVVESIGGVDYYKASVSVAANQAFAGAIFTFTVSEDGYTATGNSVIPIPVYADMILDGAYTDAEKDMAYYMLTYLKSAYKYMSLGVNEDKVVKALGYADADSAFEAIIGSYQPKTAYVGDSLGFDGSLGLEIAVDLQASPVYTFKSENAAIAKITVNGKLLSEKDSNGAYIYKIGNLCKFDETFTVITYDAEGNQISSAEFCYANYVFAANAGNEGIVKRVVADLYSYILAAKAYAETITAE